MAGLIDPNLRKKIEEYQAQPAPLAKPTIPFWMQKPPLAAQILGPAGYALPWGMKQLEKASTVAGATLTAPFRPLPEGYEAFEKPRDWRSPTLPTSFLPGGSQYEAYKKWKGGPTEPYAPLGIPSWEQWGGMLGLGEKPETYKPARMGMGDIAELAPWMFAGGPAGGRAAVKAGEMLEARTPQLVKTALKEEAGMARLPKKPIPPKPKDVPEGYLVRGDIPKPSGETIMGGTWATDDVGYATRTYGDIVSLVKKPKNVLRVESPSLYPELRARQIFGERFPIEGIGKAQDWAALRASLQKEGFDAVEFTLPNGVKETWYLRKPQLISPEQIPKPSAVPITPKPGAKLPITPSTIPQPVAAVDKMLNILKVEKPLLRETGVLRHVELQKKAGMIEKALVGGEPEAAMAQAAKFRGGKLPTAEGALRGQFTPDEASQLFGAIRDSSLRSFEKLNANDAFIKLLQTNEPLTRSEIRLLGEVFGPEFVGIFDTLGRKAVKNLLDAANLPRAVLASSDLSATLRQGGILVSRRPYLAPKFVREQVKYFFSERHLKEADDLIRSHPVFKEFNELGGYMAPLPGKAAQLWKAEEAYMSRFAHHIPVVKQSERAFVGGLNWLRFNSYVHGRRLYEKMGVATEGNLADLIKLITRASGRGDINLLKGDVGPIANAILFSPRLQLSRLQLPTMLVSKNPVTRKEAWKTMASFLAFGTGIVSMAKLAGAGVELDPRSSDFGKMKIGKTRLDIWTGFAQYARFLSQLATARRKQTETGKMVDVNRLDIIKRFVQSKLSPAAGLVNDILQGTTYLGEEMSLETESLRQQVYNRLTPLFFQDMIDATSEEGLMGGVTASAGFWGAGVVTHRPQGAPIIGKSPAQQLEDRVWAQYPQYKEIADQIRELEKTDPIAARALQRQYPQILNIRRQIALVQAQGQQATTDRQKAIEQAMKQREAALAGRS